MAQHIDTRISVAMEGRGFTITDFEADEKRGAFCTLRFGPDDTASVLFQDMSASTLKHMNC